MGYTRLRVVTTIALGMFGVVMAGIAWGELGSGFQVPDAFMIPFFGLSAFFASMVWMARHLKSLLPEPSGGQPRWEVGELAPLVFFIPGGAFYVASMVLRVSRDAVGVMSSPLWCGWAISCTGMQVSMIVELTGVGPATVFDGLYAAFGVLNAFVVAVLMWAPPRTLLLHATGCPASTWL